MLSVSDDFSLGVWELKKKEHWSKRYKLLKIT